MEYDRAVSYIGLQFISSLLYEINLIDFGIWRIWPNPPPKETDLVFRAKFD